MPIIVDLREDLERYIRKHGLSKKWERVKTLFENDPSHPSLKTELLEPKTSADLFFQDRHKI